MTTKQTLVEYLAKLDTADSSFGVWVNPENIDEYRIGQIIFENGGVRDGWNYIGNLQQLSFGFQSHEDAIKSFLELSSGEFEFNGRKVKVNIDGILTAYYEDKLSTLFKEFLDDKADEIERTWAEEEAESFVSTLTFDID